MFDVLSNAAVDRSQPPKEREEREERERYININTDDAVLTIALSLLSPLATSATHVHLVARKNNTRFLVT